MEQRHGGLAILILFGTLLAACGDDSKTTTTSVDGTTVTVDRAGGDDGKVTITSKDGDNIASVVAGSGAKWPEKAPDFAAPYPGATLVSVVSGTNDGKAGGMATFETADSPERIIAFYKARAASAGLDKVTTMTADTMTMFGAGDAAGDRSLSVQASVNDGKTMGSVTFSVPG